MVYKWLKNSLFRLIQPHCLLCLSDTNNQDTICTHCEANLPINDACCLICAGAITGTNTNHASASLDNKQLICGKCQNSRPWYTSSFIPFTYAAPLKQMITRLKFEGDLFYVPLLAGLFSRRLRNCKTRLPECLIPVPLHPARQRRRGFNQAIELARGISTHTGIPVDTKVCYRKRPTPFQSGLNAKERKRNLKNAFEIAKNVHYKHVAIIDDVVTTGTTVNELARLLHLAGVEIIEVWATVRSISHGNK